MTVPALADRPPCSPVDVDIVSLRALPCSLWDTTKHVPLRGMRNMKYTCYLNSVAQVLMRTPAVLDWVMHHGVSDCSGEGGSCVVCALFRTYCQVLACLLYTSPSPRDRG